MRAGRLGDLEGDLGAGLDGSAASRRTPAASAWSRSCSCLVAHGRAVSPRATAFPLRRLAGCQDPTAEHAPAGVPEHVRGRVQRHARDAPVPSAVSDMPSRSANASVPRRSVLPVCPVCRTLERSADVERVAGAQSCARRRARCPRRESDAARRIDVAARADSVSEPCWLEGARVRRRTSVKRWTRWPERTRTGPGRRPCPQSGHLATSDDSRMLRRSAQSVATSVELIDLGAIFDRVTCVALMCRLRTAFEMSLRSHRVAGDVVALDAIVPGSALAVAGQRHAQRHERPPLRDGRSGCDESSTSRRREGCDKRQSQASGGTEGDLAVPRVRRPRRRPDWSSPARPSVDEPLRP